MSRRPTEMERRKVLRDEREALIGEGRVMLNMTEEEDLLREQARAKAIAEPPEIPADVQDHWDKWVVPHTRSERLRAAMRWLMGGDSYREASARVGYKSPRVLYEATRDLGLQQACMRSDRAKTAIRQVAILAHERLAERLEDEDLCEAIESRDLAYAAGTASRGLAEAENWRNPQREPSNDTLSALEQIAASLADSGGSLTLTVERGEHTAAEILSEPVDVTPTLLPEGS